MKPRGNCIICGEPSKTGDSYFCVRSNGRNRWEHSDCRKRNEGAAACVGLLRMAEAIQARPKFEIGLCEDCAAKSTLTKIDGWLHCGDCERCGQPGRTAPEGSVWVYE